MANENTVWVKCARCHGTGKFGSNMVREGKCFSCEGSGHVQRAKRGTVKRERMGLTIEEINERIALGLFS